MTKFLRVFGLVLIPVELAIASPMPSIIKMTPVDDIPVQFASSSKTSSIEWGCPVAETVQAKSRVEALTKVQSACLDQARRAAAGKADVLDVIQASVIFPDVQITQAQGDSYDMKGTFFLETLVLHKLSAEK